MNDDDENARLSDTELMRLVAAGDEGAFRLIVEHNIGGMMRFATNMTGADMAEDMVQQAFTQAWKAAGRWKPKAKLSTWLYTVLRNECLQYLRKSKPDIRLVSSEDVVLTDRGALPDQKLVELDDNAALDAAIEKLPERQRTALLLRYGEDLSQREAACVMGIKEKAFESLLSRGKSRLKHLITDKNDE
tara:strand:- start:9631 stop:10197 length:567 start_codon:yes stop_codon:yes gene_type:complete